MAEALNFKEVPNFKTPEEELAFLRARIAETEKNLKEQNKEFNQEEVIKETLSAYRSIETEKILPSGRIVREEEAKGIVLRLKPETHDRKMEELLSILNEKGIKNALAVAEKFKNPHLDDDFHRFLVQYLSAAHSIPGLKEGSPVFKALNMKLFEVTLPEQSGEKKSFKEFISAMEQFYAGMQSVADSRSNDSKNYYTLEIALSNQNDEVVVYAACPEDRTELFEKQILAFYHDAKIREVADDYNIFSVNDASAAAYARLAEPEALPLKTHETIDHDPMNTLLNVFSKLKREGEGAAIQITITPAGDQFIKKFSGILKKVKDGMSIRKAMESSDSLGREFAGAFAELFTGAPAKPGKEKEKKIDDNAVSKISDKIKSTILSSSIRVIASASDAGRAEQILRDMESAFNQFSEAGGNSIIFEKISAKKLPEFLHNYSFRIPDEKENMHLNLRELSTIFHFPVGAATTPQLKVAKSGIAPAPSGMDKSGVLLGTNSYRGSETPIYMSREDRLRHFYVIGQTGTGKTVTLKNMIRQDILNGDGCCFIDPHGTDIQDILSFIPKERLDDVIYFDPAYTARPMALNMLEFDPAYPEQKTFVVNELMNIFNKLFDMKTAGGPMFEQYFRNSALLVMEDPESGSTLLEIARVLSDKAFRDLKLSRCKNPIISQFWANAEQTTGDQGLTNFVPYITSKFDVFISNDIMRPVIAQEKSVFNFRKIMDEKKILLVNLSKGRLGDINANLIGLILVGKIQMAALSRVDLYGKPMNDFYLYIDEFQNITTDSIASILSEARKYHLSLNVAHQYINQLPENIRNAVFGNVGSMVVFRVSPEDAQFLENKFKPTFTASDIIKLENLNCYVNMLSRGEPVKPFNIKVPFPPKGNAEAVEKIKELSYIKYGRPREEVEAEVMEKYSKI
jgi:hypothetical protein